jgi:TonB family protein
MKRLIGGWVVLLCIVLAGGNDANAQGTTRGRLPHYERDVAVSAQSTDNVMPQYPALLRAAEESGDVVASFVVDTLGRAYPASIQIAHATQRYFAAAVIEAIPGLRFTPAVDRAGRNVPQLVRQTVEFRWMKGGMTQVTVRDEGCTLADQDRFSDVPACASPPAMPTEPPVPISWGWSLGGENVTGAFAQSRNFMPGVEVGAQVQFPLPSRRLAIRVDGMYHSVGVTDHCPPAARDCGVEFLSADIGTFGVNLVARLNDPQVRWSPYLVGGAGVNLTGASDQPFTAYRPDHVGFQAGAGFEFRLSHATTFVESRYFDLSPGGVVAWNFGLRY